jgi:20S proteasome alpha/beta subunit
MIESYMPCRIWHRPEAKEMPMSIVVAIVGKDSIVIGADTICVNGDEIAHYTERHSKIYSASNPHFAIGLAGSKAADRFLAPCRHEFSHLDFDASVLAYTKLAFDDYGQGLRAFDFYFLFCGYDSMGEPRLERVRFLISQNDGKPYHDAAPVGSKHAIGVDRHGAWYTLANYYQKEMNIDQTMLLTYLTLREVIRHDERTKEPIEMMVVRPNLPSRRVSDAEIEELKKETGHRLDAMTKIIQAPFSIQ